MFIIIKKFQKRKIYSMDVWDFNLTFTYNKPLPVRLQQIIFELNAWANLYEIWPEVVCNVKQTTYVFG